MRARHYGILLLVLVGVIPLAAAGLFMVHRAERTALDEVRTGEERVAGLAAANLSAYVQSQLDLLRTIGSAVSPAMKLTPPQAEMVTKSYAIAFPKLRKLDVIGTAAGCQEIATARLTGVTRGRCGEVAVDSALQGTTYLGPIALSSDFAPVMTVGVPLDVAGERVGAVVAEIDMVQIRSVVSAIHAGKTGRARLVTSDGTLIAHGDPEETRRVFLREQDPYFAALQGAGERGARYRDSQGREVFAVGHLLPELGWTVIVEQPIAEAFRATRLMRRDLWITIAAAAVLALLAGLLAGRRTVSDLESLRQTVSQFAEGKLDTRAPRPRLQELQRLADQLNHMATELVRLQAEMASRERLATFARVAAGLAHDLKNPIFGVRMAVEAAVKAPTQAEATARLAVALKRELPQLQDFIEDLRRLARRDQVALRVDNVSPPALCQQVVDQLAATGRWEGVEFVATGSAGRLWADQRLLARAITNLAGNAGDACLVRRQPGMRVTIDLADAPDEKELVVTIRDTGTGISADRLQEILVHDFRSDKHGSGVGLGLGVVKHVAAAHGGRLEAASEPGIGSVFTLRLPRVARADMTAAQAATAEAKTSRKETTDGESLGVARQQG